MFKISQIELLSFMSIIKSEGYKYIGKYQEKGKEISRYIKEWSEKDGDGKVIQKVQYIDLGIDKKGRRYGGMTYPIEVECSID